MAKENSTIYLFTIEFPYGNKSETFLDEEIKYLAKSFDSIVIIPHRKKTTRRILPDNVSVNDCIANISYSKSRKLKLLLLNVNIVIKILNCELKSKGIALFFKHLKFLLDYISSQLIKTDVLKKNKLVTKSAIYYDYWFLNSTLSLSILKKNKAIETFIARGHGFDIYDHYHGSLGVPFRSWIYKHITHLFTVCEFGKNYFLKKEKNNASNKISTSLLGIKSPSKDILKKPNEHKVVVSCSSLIKLKNVELIPVVLNLCNNKIKWVHFGDGELMHELEQLKTNNNIKIDIELLGHVDNEMVLKYYQDNHIDLFLSLSSTEGLPVSMMEAQSYGIPIVAFSVDGIPEIVKNNLTGELLSPSMSKEEIAARIDHNLNKSLDSALIVKHFENNFMASKNYPKFIELLNSLN